MVTIVQKTYLICFKELNLIPFSIHGEKVRFPISQQILKLFHIPFPFIHHKTQYRICIPGLFSDSDEEK